MVIENGTWLLSVIIGVPVLLVLTIGLVVLLRFIRIWAKNSNDTTFEFKVATIVVNLGILTVVICSAFGYYPYKNDYHRLQPVSGVVKAVDTRFFAASSFVVVTYDTGMAVRCDDSRCATIHEGDRVSLLCTKEHQFGSPLHTDGWGCRWGQ